MKPANDLEDVLIKMLGKLPKVVGRRKGHSLNFTVAKKVFLFTKGGAVVIKIPEMAVDELVARGIGERLIMGKRTMREWAVIRCDKASDYRKRLALFKKALRFVTDGS